MFIADAILVLSTPVNTDK